MSVPIKYRAIGDFHEYYSGKRKAPYLTLFVGGNHEASSHLWELYYGGWVAPNIYYLGAANIVRFGPLRIAGLSGIWKGFDYHKSHHERLPYNQDDLKSIYHVRELDVRKLLQVKTQVDIGISHDWPRGVEWMGNWKELFANKNHFEADARAGTLGSPAAKYVMDRLRPPYWFSAHLHCKFSAIIKHAENESLSAYPKHETSEHRLVEAKDSLKNVQNGTNIGGAASTEPETAGGSAPSRNIDEIDLDPEDDEIARPTLDEVTQNLKQPETGALSRNDDEIDLDLEDDEIAHPIPDKVTHSSPQSEPAQPNQQEDSIPESIRAQLPASFAKPVQKAQALPTSTPPKIISKTTNFLALDKCLPKRKFLQFLSIDPINPPEGSKSSNTNLPYHLSYDKEWLAITRVFASDLILGDPSSPISPNKGEAFYQPLIAAEEAWVEANFEKKGLMKIPENFEITAPIYDPAIGIGTREQPKEYTNPQTVAFCELVGIENKFLASEEEREARRLQGPKAGEMRSFGGRGRGGGRGFRGHGGGGGGGGRGRGRDRGRGNGRGY